MVGKLLAPCGALIIGGVGMSFCYPLSEGFKGTLAHAALACSNAAGISSSREKTSVKISVAHDVIQ